MIYYKQVKNAERGQSVIITIKGNSVFYTIQI